MDLKHNILSFFLSLNNNITQIITCCLLQMNEKKLKCILIDYLMDTYPTALLIGVEIPFISMKRRVDVLLITQEKQLIAFEIKSDQDTLRRLNDQITDYKKTFDKLFIVTSDKYKDICQSIPKTIGCLYCNDNNIKVIREASIVKRLSKHNLSFFLQRKDFQKIGYTQDAPILELRKKLVNSRSIQSLHSLAIISILDRYSERYALFKRYKEHKTTLQDLDYLTKPFDLLL